MDQREQIERVADVLKNWRKYSSPESTSTRGRVHAGIKHIKGHEESVAEIILRRNLHSRNAVSSMYKMAHSVDLLLDLNLNWKDRTDLARLLLSSLTYAKIYELQKKDESDWRSPYIIVLTDGTAVEERPAPDKTKFKEFPMWERNVDAEGNVLVKACKPQSPEDEHKPRIPEDANMFDHDAVPWLHAVRILEGVGFRINEQFLELVEKLDADPPTRLIHEFPPDYDQQRQEHDDKREPLGMDELDKKHIAGEEIDWPEESIRATWWKHNYLIEDRRKAFKQRYDKFHDQIKEANRLKGKVFYHRLKMCHRGRIYYPAEFSIQGSDFARAVIEFDRSVNLDMDGWEALLLHAQNVSDGSADHEEKMNKAQERVGECLQICLNPEGTFDWWKDADKPYCFLRAAMEIGDAMAIQFSRDDYDMEEHNEQERELIERGLERWKSTGRGEIGLDGYPNFTTRLPVEMDQSNSAYQHIALMMQDESLMARANMGESYSDLYSKVAEHKDLDIEGLDDPKEKRKIVKTVSVPWGYGSGWESCANDLDSFRRDNPERAKYLWTLEIQGLNRLARTVIGILESEFKACVAYRNMVKLVVEKVEKSGQKDRVEFKTPSMFDMVIRKCAFTDGDDSPQVEVWSGEKNVDLKVREPLGVQWYTDERGQKSIQSAAPASLVHSMDATLIHLVVAFGRFKELRVGDGLEMEHKIEDWIWYPVATCHDAFFCLAPYAKDLKERLEQGLLELYSKFDPLRTFVAMNLIPDQPYNPTPFNPNLKTGKNIFD